MNSDDERRSCMDPGQEYVLRRMDDALVLHASRVFELAAAGKTAVIIHEMDPIMLPLAVLCGWDGSTPVFAMTDEAAAALSELDRVTRRWIRAAPGVAPGRTLVKVFLIIDIGTFLLNCDGKGWSFEPGSLDAEHAKQLS